MKVRVVRFKLTLTSALSRCETENSATIESY